MLSHHFSLFSLAKYAEESCSVLISSVFERCHHEVSPTPYVKNCHFDVCSCSSGKDCLCSSIANYATACAMKNVVVQWRAPDFCCKCNTPKSYLFSFSQKNFLAILNGKQNTIVTLKIFLVRISHSLLLTTRQAYSRFSEVLSMHILNISRTDILQPLWHLAQCLKNCLGD